MTIRSTGYGTLFTALPIQPMDTDVPNAGEVYPSARAIRRSSGSDKTATADTPTINWASQGTQYFWRNYPYDGMKTATFTSAYVDWASVIRTYQRPRNPCGGIPRYTKSLGTATAPDLVTTQALYEERYPLLVPPNTFVEARKLAPSSGDMPSGFFDALNPPLYVAMRWFGGSTAAQGNGGSMGVTVYAGGTGATIDIYATPIDSVTLAPGTTALLKSITEIGGGPTFSTIDNDDFVAAGVIPFDQFWLSTSTLQDPYYDPMTPELFEDWYVSWSANPPDNIPAPYDIAGSYPPSTWLPGGYFA